MKSGTILTSGSREAGLWVVVNAFDKYAKGSDGAVKPWHSRQLGRLEQALKEAGWRDATGARRETHLRALAPFEPLSHYEARGVTPEPRDRARFRTVVERHKPAVIVTVGDKTLESVTGHTSASKWAGSPLWQPDLDCYVIPVEDPFTWLYDHTKHHAAVRDLRKAVWIAQGVEPEIRRAEVEILRDFDRALGFLSDLRLRASQGVLTSLDIEAWGGTEPGSEKLVRSIAWSDKSYHAYVLPLTTIKGHSLWTTAELDAILLLLREALSHPNGQWVLQNAIFDDTVLRDSLQIPICGTVHDTMARHNVLYPDQPKNLGFLVRWYLAWDIYHKEDAKAWKPNSNAKDEDLWRYNGVDADTTRRVFLAQENEPRVMYGGEFASAYNEQLSSLPELYRAVRDISLGGVRVDMDFLSKAREENQRVIGEFAQELAEILERPVFVATPEKEEIRAELRKLAETFGMPQLATAPVTKKKKEILASLIPALLPGQAGPILAGLLGAGIDPLAAVDALASGKLPRRQTFIFSSKDQVKELLYDELGLKPQTKRRIKTTGERTETVTSDTAALKKLISDIERLPDPNTKASRVLNIFLALASLTQLEKAYFSAVPSKDGRFRGAYNIAGTTTRRFACNKWHDGTGFNLMTFPRGDFVYGIPGLTQEQRARLGKIAKALKLSILPDNPGEIIVNMDLAQAEARTVAYESRDPKMIYGFTSGVDFHSFNAMNIWGFPSIEAVPKHKRQDAKIAGHGCNYLMGIGTLAKDMQISYAQAKQARDGYFAAYSCIPEWHKAVRGRLLRGLPILNAFNWPRSVHLDPSEQDTLRAIVAHIPQSTIPAAINRAWLEYRRMGQPFGRIMMQTHDSLTASVPIENVDDFCALMKELVEKPIPVTDIMGPFAEGEATEYIIPCDFEIGPRYGELERYLTEEEEERVKKMMGEEKSDAEIAKLCGVNKDAVAAVRAGRGRDWWKRTGSNGIERERTENEGKRMETKGGKSE